MEENYFEIVEVEEEPKKVKKEEPVAKKIELPKVEKEVEYTLDDDIELDTPEKENKFPIHKINNDLK